MKSWTAVYHWPKFPSPSIFTPNKNRHDGVCVALARPEAAIPYVLRKPKNHVTTGVYIALARAEKTIFSPEKKTARFPTSHLLIRGSALATCGVAKDPIVLS